MTRSQLVLTVYSSRATSPTCELPHNLPLRIDNALAPPSAMLIKTLMPLKGNSEAHASSHMRTEEGGPLG